MRHRNERSGPGVGKIVLGVIIAVALLYVIPRLIAVAIVLSGR